MLLRLPRIPGLKRKQSRVLITIIIIICLTLWCSNLFSHVYSFIKNHELSSSDTADLTIIHGKQYNLMIGRDPWAHSSVKSKKSLFFIIIIIIIVTLI